MASEFETEARAELENAARQEKVSAFLQSGHANHVADLALAAYWDHIQAKLLAESYERTMRTQAVAQEITGRRVSDSRPERDAALAEANMHFRKAADYAAIAGAVQIVQSQHSTEV